MALAGLLTAAPTLIKGVVGLGQLIGNGIRKIRDRIQARREARRNKMRAQPGGIRQFGRRIKMKFQNWRDRIRKRRPDLKRGIEKGREAVGRLSQVIDQVGQVGAAIGNVGGQIGGSVGKTIGRIGGGVSGGAQSAKGGLGRLTDSARQLESNLMQMRDQLRSRKQRSAVGGRRLSVRENDYNGRRVAYVGGREREDFSGSAGGPARVMIIGFDSNQRIRPVPIGTEMAMPGFGGGPGPYPLSRTESLAPRAGLGVPQSEWSRYASVINPTWGDDRHFGNQITADAVRYLRPKTQHVGSVQSADSRLQGPSVMEIRPLFLPADNAADYDSHLAHQGPFLAPPMLTPEVERGRMDYETGPDW